MSKRESKQLITETITPDVAEQYLADYAKADAEQAKLNAQMDLEMTKIREKYQERIQKLQELKDATFEKVQHFATTNPDLFAKKRSYEFTHGIVGFRLGTPSLKTVKGFTWSSVLQLAKDYCPQYIRTKEEVNKELLLNERTSEDTVQLMQKIGVKVEQSEAFYVELKKEAVPA